MKKSKGKITIIAALILIVGGYAGYDNVTEILDDISTDALIDDTVATGDMRVTYLDVGQGDCIIVQTEERNMMIDAGDNDQGESVVSYLREQGITELDYLILTHPDADHIGGGDNVLENLDVQTIIMPDEVNDTMTYDEVMEDIETYEIEIIHPSPGDVYTLGDAEFTILCPEEDVMRENDTNDASVGIKLVHGSNSFVMTGDAEKASEEAMVERFGSSLECDVLKCGHHGSSTATTDEFLEATNPTWAVISCGADNKYGHPHREVIDKLEKDDIQIYRTDELGTIVADSDGTEIHWSVKE